LITFELPFQFVLTLSTTKNILNDFDLRKTKTRSEILDLFLTQPQAISYTDIEESLDQNHDRVTVYRTLKTFLEKGIIHKIPSDSGNPKYALCPDECSEEQHSHEHVHFKCESCAQTTCLETVQVPQIKLPMGYTSRESSLLVTGYCANCSAK
jgi:Fur family ferric uptake transcriptional regulator